MIKIELIRFEAQDVITASVTHKLVGPTWWHDHKRYQWCATHNRHEEV